MASPTKKTKLIRKRKLTGQGKDRKRVIKANGTTQSAASLFGDE